MNENDRVDNEIYIGVIGNSNSMFVAVCFSEVGVRRGRRITKIKGGNKK